MIARLVVVLVVVGLAFAVRVARDRRRRWSGEESLPGARFPSWVTEGAERTWVVFTTPYCASCGPIVDHLGTADPVARVVTVDASHELALARDFAVRRAPTVFEADGQGTPLRRLSGADAVREAVPA
jgi:hypothetical protein